MTKNLQKYSGLIAVLAVALIVSVSPAPVSAEEYTGTLNTGQGLQSGVGGTAMGAPTASPAAGTYTSNQSVTLTAAGSDSIHYTTSGVAPTCTSGITYSGAIPVSSTVTIRAISCYPSNQSFLADSLTYTLQCAITSVSNGSVSAYPTCGITCNSGYTKSGNSCVYSAGGGASGGYTPVSTPTPTPSPTLIPAPTVPTAPVTIPALPSKPTDVDISNVLTAAMRQVLYIQANISASNALTLLLDVTQRLAQLRTALGQAVPAGSLTANLSPGSRGDNVMALQNFLKAQGAEIFPEGLVTGYFGPFTRKAVERFQVKYGIAKAGDAGYGFAGPKTRAKINSLLGL